MQNNNKTSKEKSQEIKNRTIKMSQYITKTNISNPKNLIIAGKDNVYTQKKRNRF